MAGRRVFGMSFYHEVRPHGTVEPPALARDGAVENGRFAELGTIIVNGVGFCLHQKTPGCRGICDFQEREGHGRGTQPISDASALCHDVAKKEAFGVLGRCRLNGSPEMLNTVKKVDGLAYRDDALDVISCEPLDRQEGLGLGRVEEMDAVYAG